MAAVFLLPVAIIISIFISSCTSYFISVFMCISKEIKHIFIFKCINCELLNLNTGDKTEKKLYTLTFQHILKFDFI